MRLKRTERICLGHEMAVLDALMNKKVRVTFRVVFWADLSQRLFWLRDIRFRFSPEL